MRWQACSARCSFSSCCLRDIALCYGRRVAPSSLSLRWGRGEGALRVLDASLLKVRAGATRGRVDDEDDKHLLAASTLTSSPLPEHTLALPPGGRHEPRTRGDLADMGGKGLSLYASSSRGWPGVQPHLQNPHARTAGQPHRDASTSTSWMSASMKLPLVAGVPASCPLPPPPPHPPIPNLP